MSDQIQGRVLEEATEKRGCISESGKTQYKGTSQESTGMTPAKILKNNGYVA